jgi:hypothetical protein
MIDVIGSDVQQFDMRMTDAEMRLAAEYIRVFQDEGATSVSSVCPLLQTPTSLHQVVDSNHALSLGARAYLISTNEVFNEEVRLKSAIVEKDFRDQYDLVETTEGFHVLHNFTACDEAHIVIWIAPEAKLLRVMELIVHEVSHLVDGLFARAAMNDAVDTEVRAYHMDWICGLYFAEINALNNEATNESSK